MFSIVPHSQESEEGKGVEEEEVICKEVRILTIKDLKLLNTAEFVLPYMYSLAYHPWYIHMFPRHSPKGNNWECQSTSTDRSDQSKSDMMGDRQKPETAALSTSYGPRLIKCHYYTDAVTGHWLHTHIS